MTVKERISEYQGLKGYSDFAFERAVGKGRGSWHSTKNPSADFLTLIFTTFPDLSAEYVFRGEGDMLRTVPTSPSSRTSDPQEQTIPYYKEMIKYKDERIAKLEDEIVRLRLLCDQLKI